MTYILSSVTLGVGCRNLTSLSICQSRPCQKRAHWTCWSLSERSIPVLHTHPAEDGTKKMKVTVVFTKAFNEQRINYHVVLPFFSALSFMHGDAGSAPVKVCVFYSSLFLQYLSSGDGVVSVIWSTLVPPPWMWKLHLWLSACVPWPSPLPKVRTLLSWLANTHCKPRN